MKKIKMNLPGCRNIQNVLYYHSTDKKNVYSISKEGLQRKYSNLKAIQQLHYDFMKYDNPKYTLKQAKRDVPEKLLFFSKEPEGINNIEKESLLLGVLNKRSKITGQLCHKDIFDQEVNAFGESISANDIPPDCLCIVAKKHYQDFIN